MPGIRDFLPPFPGEPTKICLYEGLLDVLSDIFDLSTAEVTRKLIAHDIRSYTSFKKKVFVAARDVF